MKHLTVAKTQILKSFIKDFLPENDRLIKVSETELIYITKTLNGILERWFGFKAEVVDVFDVFEKNGYALSVIEPRKASRTEAPYIETNSGAIYINVSPLTIRELERVIAYFQDEEGIVKTSKVQELLTRLTEFKKSNI